MSCTEYSGIFNGTQPHLKEPYPILHQTYTVLSIAGCHRFRFLHIFLRTQIRGLFSVDEMCIQSGWGSGVTNRRFRSLSCLL